MQFLQICRIYAKRAVYSLCTKSPFGELKPSSSAKRSSEYVPRTRSKLTAGPAGSFIVPVHLSIRGIEKDVDRHSEADSIIGYTDELNTGIKDSVNAGRTPRSNTYGFLLRRKVCTATRVFNHQKAKEGSFSIQLPRLVALLQAAR